MVSSSSHLIFNLATWVGSWFLVRGILLFDVVSGVPPWVFPCGAVAPCGVEVPHVVLTCHQSQMSQQPERFRSGLWQFYLAQVYVIPVQALNLVLSKRSGVRLVLTSQEDACYFWREALRSQGNLDGASFTAGCRCLLPLPPSLSLPLLPQLLPSTHA